MSRAGIVAIWFPAVLSQRRHLGARRAQSSAGIDRRFMGACARLCALAWHWHEMLSTGVTTAASSVNYGDLWRHDRGRAFAHSVAVLPHTYMVVIGAAGAAWIAAFALFLLEYAPMLLGPRR